MIDLELHRVTVHAGISPNSRKGLDIPKVFFLDAKDWLRTKSAVCITNQSTIFPMSPLSPHTTKPATHIVYHAIANSDLHSLDIHQTTFSSKWHESLSDPTAILLLDQHLETISTQYPHAVAYAILDAPFSEKFPHDSQSFTSKHLMSLPNLHVHSLHQNIPDPESASENEWLPSSHPDFLNLLGYQTDAAAIITRALLASHIPPIGRPIEIDNEIGKGKDTIHMKQVVEGYDSLLEALRAAHASLTNPYLFSQWKQITRHISQQTHPSLPSEVRLHQGKNPGFMLVRPSPKVRDHLHTTDNSRWWAFSYTPNATLSILRRKGISTTRPNYNGDR